MIIITTFIYFYSLFLIYCFFYSKELSSTIKEYTSFEYNLLNRIIKNM